MSQVKVLFQTDKDQLDSGGNSLLKKVERNVENAFNSMKSGDYFGDVFTHVETDQYKRFKHETENFIFSIMGNGGKDKTKMAYLVKRK